MKSFPDYRIKGPLTLAQRSNHLAITAKFYDFWRKRSLSLILGQPFSLEKELKLMTEWLDILPNQPFLDIGTGTGNYARALKQAGAKVTAIDISEEMLKKAQSLDNDIEYELVNAEMLPYPDASFDGVVISTTLTEFFHPEKALNEVSRILKPQGKLFLLYICPAKSVLGRSLQLFFEIFGVRFPKRNWIKGVLEKNGMNLVRDLQKGVVVFELYQR